MLYLDSSYIVRLYLEDQGFAAVRELAATDQIACCLHGRAETVAAFHRKMRDGHFTARELRDIIENFGQDCATGAVYWFPLSSVTVSDLVRVYIKLPKTFPLRAADALHLACAAENGFRAIYSNDKRLLAAASHFGIKGVDVI